MSRDALKLASASEAGPAAPFAPDATPAAARVARGQETIVGMPARKSAADLLGASPVEAPAALSARGGKTILGFAGPRVGPLSGGGEVQELAPLQEPAAAQGGGKTLVGVARPGIAPLAASVDRPRGDGLSDASRKDVPRELGATIAPARQPPKIPEPDPALRRRRILLPPAAAARRAKDLKDVNAVEERRARRAIALVLAGGGLAVVAVIVALVGPSSSPLLARVKADSAGHEGVELTCASCPDGTKLSLLGASAVTAGGVALVPLATPLAVGDNRLKVAIDRPGNGRDETVSLTVGVGYRIRPELSGLQADRPNFQIVAEVGAGTSVTIDGRKMALSAGRGAEAIDVTEDCSGLASEVKTLTRQVPYVVTPESGSPEQGAVNVAVGIVPLRLDAPLALGNIAPHVTTDGPSFVLAGSTLRGAEVLAAGRPIAVRPDGSFAQVMNVSSVGATQIEVRAKMPGMAPRLAQVKVRRVESLERAAKEFVASEPPVAFADLAANVEGAAGKPVALTGEISESKKQGYSTLSLFEVDSASGCASSCTVRLVQASETAPKRGDKLRVFGHVVRAFPLPDGKATVPEIEVDFTLKGDVAKDGR